MAIAPDDKDWTWVLLRPCPECGFDATRVQAAEVSGCIKAAADRLVDALVKPAARQRPRPDRWSPCEYACHVRDVHLVFAQRLRLMLQEDDPLFANWDQDETAVSERYGDQAPEVVAQQLLGAASDVAALYDAVPGDAWDRVGRRSNGSVFTVDSLARYHLHDVVHHLWDVEGDGIHDVPPVVRLRSVEDGDLDVFFDHQADPQAVEMAAFPARDKDQFAAHWAKLRADDTKVVRTIVAGGTVAGNLGSWQDDGQQLFGYWLGREHWGRGIATRALALFVDEVSIRPLHAHVVAHNVASIRVLEKCGFRRDREHEANAPAPDDGIEELHYVLNA